MAGKILRRGIGQARFSVEILGSQRHYLGGMNAPVVAVLWLCSRRQSVVHVDYPAGKQSKGTITSIIDKSDYTVGAFLPLFSFLPGVFTCVLLCTHSFLPSVPRRRHHYAEARHQPCSRQHCPPAARQDQRACGGKHLHHCSCSRANMAQTSSGRKRRPPMSRVGEARVCLRS